MLALMLENQADSPFANLRRITCRMSSHNSSPFSQDGASGKAGAVHTDALFLLVSKSDEVTTT